MARVRQRGKSWNAEIRRVGVPPISKTFATKEEAEIWLATEEAYILERRSFRPQKALVAEHQILRASAADVVCAASPFHSGSGVYVLINGVSIVYVGQARNVLTRILQHEKNGRPFTHYVVIPCPPDDMTRLEKAVIQRFMPIQNRQHVPHQRPNAPETRAVA